MALRDPSVGRPTGLVAASGADSIQLDWDANRQSRIRGYQVYRAEDLAGPFADQLDEFAQLPGYLDAELTLATLYHYQVTGISFFFLPGNSQPRVVESQPSDHVSASAGNVLLSLRPVCGPPATDVVVPISINNTLGLRSDGLDFQISYDPLVLTPLAQAAPGEASVLATGLSDGLTFSDDGATANGVLTITASAGEIAAGSGKLFDLQFRINLGAQIGEQTSLSISAATLFSTAGGALVVDFAVPTTVSIEDHFFPGDVTGDGLLTADDQALLEALSKPGAPEPSAGELCAGDLNGDGKLSNRDLLFLGRLLEQLEL